MSKLGAPLGKYKRWHTYDQNGVKRIASVEIGVDPNINSDTVWILGNGPLTPTAYTNLLMAIANNVTGIPKSEATKQKMRDAKLGVPKSAEHKKNMSISHKARKRKEL